MKLEQFESEGRERREMPWRKHAPPVNKPTNPDNPNHKGPINHDEWNRSANQYPKKSVEEEVDGIPEVGDVIRTKKMQMEGKVESLGQNRAGYPEVMFRIEDGRLMKTPLSNVTVVQKLADDDIVMEVAGERVDEISTEVLAKYKAAAGKDASEADKKGDFAKGNKRFSGIVKATKKQFDNDSKKREINELTIPGVEDNFTADDIKRLEQITDIPTLKAQAKELVKGKAARRMKPEKISWFYNAIDGKSNKMAVIKLMYDLLLAGEGNSVVGTRHSMRQNDYRDRFGEGSMGGINRSAPAQDVSYEHVLDEVKAMWEKAQINELSVETLKAYKDAATSQETLKHSPLRKVAKHMQGAGIANQKIKTKTGDKVGMHQPDRGTYENVNEDDPMVSQLKKQYADSQAQAPKRKAVPFDFHGYTIKYLAQSKPTDKVEWVVYNKKDEKVGSGTAMNDKEAVTAAQDHIKQGSMSKEKVTSNVTIDFNEQFRDWFSKEGDKFYATIVNDNGVPTLLLSTEPQKTLKTSHSRSSTHLPMISLTANESNDAGLQPFGRYLLGSKEDLGDNLLMFPLILQDTTQSKTDKKRLGAPGLTVAASGRAE